MSKRESSNHEQSSIVARELPGGVSLLAEQMPGFHTATAMLRIDGGLCSEPAEKLGLAYVLEQTIDKGTASFDARQLADAYDVIGAHSAVYTGRESWLLVVSSLPEHLPRAIELLGETVCKPVFPAEMVETAVSLTLQELSSLEDSPRGLLRRLMARQVYGDVLGRHALGNEETLARITPAAVREHWSARCSQRAISAVVAGNFDLGAVESTLAGWIETLPAGQELGQREIEPFAAARGHLQKDLEQTQIGISLPGVPYDHAEQDTERVLLGVLSGGMSSRLFTEVREKQGLVYWVSAWHEQPRGLGMVHIGAATKPKRAERTYETLLREVARLQEDLEEGELERAKVGLIADSATSGASVQQRANELMVDYFHLGRAVPAEAKREAIRAVTLDDIRRYLETHPRDALSIVTVGREALSA